MEVLVFENADRFIAADVFRKYQIDHCIVSTVVNEAGAIEKYIRDKVPYFVFSADTPSPLKNLYSSAHTLGSDRLAAAAGGNALFPGSNVLVIDAGTCIKYNFVTDNNEFLGGGISPGLRMRFAALNEYTSRLPLLALQTDFNTLIGTTTTDSILSGIQLGTIAEADGIIDKYKELYNNLTVVLTGGDFNFFEKRLKNSIFADQFLILKGLNVILDYTINAKK